MQSAAKSLEKLPVTTPHISLDLFIPVCLPWDMMGAAVGDDGRPQDGIWETLVSQWLLSGPLALQFACFDASSGIQQRIGELNHSGGGEEGEGRINYLWISAVYSNCHTTHVYTCIATVTLHMYTSPERNTV